MNALTTKLWISGILAVFTLISGVIVTQAGRPLNSILFNIHKLISVATVAMILVSVIALYKAGEAKTSIELGLIVLTGVLFAALVATGGMLSFEREWPAVVLRIHQAAPLLSLAFAVLSFFLLLRGRA